MRQTTVRGTLSLRGFRKLRTGAIVATGVILLGLGFLAPTVSANEQDGVWVARTVAEVKADIQNIDNLSHYTIKWGDTLSAISGATGLSVDSLVEINRIANRDLIFANNKLYFSEEAFLKDGNTEVRRQQVSIANSGSCQSYEVETKTDTVTGEQTTTVKQTTPVVVETPAVSAVKAEESVSPALKSETPVTVAPKVETREEVSNAPSLGTITSADSGESSPATDNAPSNTGTTNQPVASNPSSEVPASSVSSPEVEEPSAPAPKAEEPATPAPKADEPAATTPKAEEPVATTPKAAEPSAPAPKADEPAAPAPKAEEPAAPAPKVEDTVASKEDTSAPNADKLTTNQNGDGTNPVDSKDESSTPTPETSTSEPKSAEPTTSAPKNDESGSSVESPSTGNHSEESGTPSETPTGGSTATQPSDTSTELVTPGETSTPAQPAGEVDKSEVSNPSPNATNEGDSGASTPVTDNAPSNAGTTNQPVSSNSSSESPAPKADTPSEEVAPKDEKLEEAKKDGKDIIEKIAASKLSEIEKVKDEAEKVKLEAKLKELKESGLEAINNAKDHDDAVDATAEYQSKIDEIDVPGEELPAPNYNKDNLTNGRNEGTTIDNGSTVIGHGSGEVTATSPTQPVTEERSTSTVSPEGSSTQPASTETTAGTSSFRNAPSVQVRARRVARSTSEPDGTVNISYNFAGMPDIHGFLSDPGENNTVTISAGTNEEQAKELVKEKIQAKIKDLATRGYHVKNDIIFEQDTTVKNYNYVVTFTKEVTGTSGFRMAPAVQPRASRNRRSLEQPAPQKVKVNVFYNFDQMKDIAGFLGDINGTSLEIAEGLSNEQVKVAVKSQVDAKKEELSKRGYTFKEDYVYQANGKDYNYVVTFSKSTK